MSQVTYTLELIPANASKIDQINRIVLGAAYTTEGANIKAAPSTSAPAKQADADVAADDLKSASQGAAEASTTTLEELKNAAKKAKKDHGEEFTMQVLKDAGVKVGSSLGRSMSAVSANQYDEVIALWVAGPQTAPAADEPEDDGFGDEDDGLEEDTSEVTAEAVKTALKAYSKSAGRDEAKAIMTEHGASALSKVDDCTPAQLKAMFAKLV
tara:strand:+ start:291 stop:926 length:636 start_codon:yes stop_codon:yes gene_type:complete